MRMVTMAKHSLYLREEVEIELKRLAIGVGLDPDAYIKRHVSKLFDGTSIDAIEARFARLERRVEAVFSMLEIIASEAAFTSGVNRAASQGSKPYLQAGSSRSETCLEAIRSIKNQLKSHESGEK
jgi:hypothetical protein